MSASPARAEHLALSERDQAILTFERGWWKYDGSKEEGIRATLHMSAGDYYQVLNALLDSEAALAFDGVLVHRLRRMRSTRQRLRSARRLDLPPTLA